MMVIAASVAAIVTAIVVPGVRRWAMDHHIVDDPGVESFRRMHVTPVPLLGGLAVWCSIVIVVGVFTAMGLTTAGYISVWHLVSLGVASLVIMIGGYLDDRYHLRASRSILFPALAALIIVASGIGVNFITNPFGGVFRIDQWKITLGEFGVFTVGADLFAFAWLMGMMYTTKLLDGLDGLVSGVTAIGAVVIALLSLTVAVHQPDTAIVAIIVAGAFLGFLPFNWSPAKMFLGEGGSVLAGFLLGVLSIVAGGKIATTLLVLGIPALDVLWVILRRLLSGQAAHQADRKHLHFRLLEFLSTQQTVLFYYATAVLFGMVAIFAPSSGKLLALVALVCFMVILASTVLRYSRRKS